MHQPLVFVVGKLERNLKKMLISKDSKESWDAKLIARAYKNPATYVEKLTKFDPKLILDFSGIFVRRFEPAFRFTRKCLCWKR